MNQPPLRAGIERRATVRYGRERRPVRCAVEAPEKEERWAARIQDVSVAGMSLLVHRRFDPGIVLEVEVAVSGRRPVLLIPMRVIRVAAAQNGHWQHGCLFEEALAQKELKALLDE